MTNIATTKNVMGNARTWEMSCKHVKNHSQKNTFYRKPCFGLRALQLPNHIHSCAESLVNGLYKTSTAQLLLNVHIMSGSVSQTASALVKVIAFNWGFDFMRVCQSWEWWMSCLLQACSTCAFVGSSKSMGQLCYLVSTDNIYFPRKSYD